MNNVLSFLITILSNKILQINYFAFQHQYHTKIEEFLERVQMQMVKCLIEKVGTTVTLTQSSTFSFNI